MKRIISMSLGCFYNPYKTRDINKRIQTCSKFNLDGIELIGSVDELMKLKLTNSNLNFLRSLKFNTIHTPFKHNSVKKFQLYNDSKTKKILKKIYKLYDQINAKNINFHPHQIKSFKIFDTENYQHSIENMEVKHGFKLKDYQAILKKNPDFKFVLDTTHASEANELNELIKGLKNKIIYFHLSANYLNHLHLPLNILNKEYLTFLNPIQKLKQPVIIENQTGSNNIKDYQKEIDFVRKWLKK